MSREIPPCWKSVCAFGPGRDAKRHALERLKRVQKWDPTARLIRISRPAPMGRLTTKSSRAGWTALYHVIQRYCHPSPLRRPTLAGRRRGPSAWYNWDVVTVSKVS